jgi:RimJ/RimL family protein N-acetyltransferase
VTPEPPEPPVLTGDGVVLRPWELSDAADVLALALDPVSRRWSPSLRSVSTPEQAVGWIADRQQRGTQWAVTHPATGELLGRIGLHHWDAQDSCAEVGYGVLPAHRRRGIARRAVEAAVRYGFDDRALHRVNLEHAVGNVGSCMVARACGFAAEGTKRLGLPRGDSEWENTHLHGRLASDPPGPLLTPPAPIEPVEIAAGPYQLCVPNPDLDAAAVLAACDDDLVRLYNAGPADLAAAYAWCASRADWTSGTHASWLVKDTLGELLGAVSVFNIDPKSVTGQAGYWVAAPARGRGVASSALAAAARFAFGALGLSRVDLFHSVENVGSCRTALKAGFPQEGTHRQSYRYGDGERHDEHSHARLASDPD